MDSKILAGAGAVVVAAAVAPFLSSYPLTLLTQVAIMAILAMSLDVLLGYTGLPSLGHAAYFGVAAYAVGILSTERQAGFGTCFVVVIVGGLGSLPGAMVGSLMVGLLDNFGKALFPELSYFTLFAPMVAMLAIKPTGLYGRA